MRRPVALLIVMALTLSLVAACTKTDLSNLPKDPPEAGTTLVVHYHRYAGDYSDWDLWVWPNGMEGAGYPFTDDDDYGKVAVIQFPDRHEKLGFIVRKGGGAWTAKDVSKDRFIELTDGFAEIWLLEGEEEFATSADQISTEPRIQTAYLDDTRTVIARLSHPVDMATVSPSDFSLQPAVPITTVRDTREQDITRIGYEFIDNMTKVRFVAKPGALSFRDTAADAKAEVYVSGSFNAWGGTLNGSFKPDPDWRMTWNNDQGWYELIKPVGNGEGQVPAAGAAFKFTENSGSQNWFPGADINLVPPTDAGTRELVLTLGADADVTVHYELQHKQLLPSAVIKRGVLNDPAFIYTGNDLGHTYSAAQTKFRLWAPTVGGVEVIIYDQPEGSSGHAHVLSKSQGGTWYGEVSGDLKGKYYTYRLSMGSSKTEVMDPYAVGAGVNGNRGLIVNLRETDPPGFRSAPRPAFGQITDAVIYELHVRDLSTHPSSGISNKGKFLAFTERGTTGPQGVKTGVDHLVELGITHVHLLPVFDFASVDEKRSDQFNWGYDPKNFNGAGGLTNVIQRGVAGSIEYSSTIRDFTLHPTETINYVSSHDNLTLWDKLNLSNRNDTEADRIRMNLLSQAIVFTSQGVPFIAGGEEMLRTKGGNHNSYNSPDSVNQFDWNRKAQYPEVLAYYQGLIALRKAHPAFRLTTAEQVQNHLEFMKSPAGTVAFWLKDSAGGDSWRQIVVIYNPHKETIEVDLPRGGAWEVAAYDQKVGNGPVSPAVSGKAKVPPISMMVLYQR